MKLQIKQDSNILSQLPYQAPEGYYYIVEDLKRGWKGIWLCTNRHFSYTTETVKTIHSFYEEKTGKFYAPINSKKPGKEVDINKTRNWTTMPLNLNPLMACLA